MSITRTYFPPAQWTCPKCGQKVIHNIRASTHKPFCASKKHTKAVDMVAEPIPAAVRQQNLRERKRANGGLDNAV